MAATDLERLVVQLSADLTKYERAMARAQGVTNRQLGAIQKKANSVGAGIGASFARAGAAILGGLAVEKVAREMLSLSEAATRIDNSLKVAGLSGAELESTYEKLSAAAKKNGAPIESLVGLYSKVSLVQKELNVSSEELIDFSGNVALALRVAGADAQSASGALLQLSQALGGGTVRAEEFNSVLEGAPTIVRAVAAGLKEAGGSVAELRKLVIGGEVSSQAFFRAFEAGVPVLEQKVAGATFTVAQATTNLQTALIDVVREFNNSTGASERFAGGINTAADAVSSFDVSGFIDKIREMRGELDGFLQDLGNADIFQKLNELMGVTKDGLVVNVDKTEADAKVTALEAEVKLLQERIALNTSLGFDNSEALARLNEVRGALAQLRAEAASMPETVGAVTAGGEATTTGTNGNMGGPSTRGGARRPVAVNPVSIADFAVPASSGSGKKKGGGGGKSKQSEYAREVEQIRERTAALQAETAAQATVNPLVDDYGYAIEKARTEHDLLAAAQEAGLAITPQLKTSIAQLAEGYAQASVEAQKLQESQEGVRQAAEDFKRLGKDVASGFISDLRAGKSAAEALSGALNKVLDQLIEMALNAAFGLGGMGGGGAGGIFGAIASLFLKDGGPVQKFASGGSVRGPGGPRSDSVPAMLSNGEYVINAAATKKNKALLEAINSGKISAFASGGMVGSAPRMPSMPSASQRGMGVHVTVGLAADSELNIMPQVEAVSRREVTSAAPKIVSASQQRVMPTIANYQQSKAGGNYRD